MKLNISIIDAFTTKQFSGNQAAVVLLDEWLSTEVMQNIAVENNLSETAFVVRNASGVFDIRWFSPIREVDFCGHATLASAYVLFSKEKELLEIIFWAEAVGAMTVKNTEGGLIEMAFPNREPVEISDVPKALMEGLSVAPMAYLKSQQAYFAIMANEDHVKSVIPDVEKLKTLDPFDVVVTAPGKEFDFVSRYFWPANGGVEDPVTGSIHAGLAPYWAKRLNRNTLVALQASHRSGVLYCRVGEDKVFVSGYCVRYLEGCISI
jgi:PhzF family phenazine biosynthesis protein